MEYLERVNSDFQLCSSSINRDYMLFEAVMDIIKCMLLGRNKTVPRGKSISEYIPVMI